MKHLLPENIKKLRLERNLTQKQLAHELGMTSSAISAYESGARSPSIDNLCKLAAFFSTSVDYMIGYIPPEYSSTGRKVMEEQLVTSVRETVEEYGIATIFDSSHWQGVCDLQRIIALIPSLKSHFISIAEP